MMHGEGQALSSLQSMTGFSTEPIPSISHLARSPGSRKTGGSRKTPTPTVSCDYDVAGFEV
jgi:hypothetical protein